MKQIVTLFILIAFTFCSNTGNGQTNIISTSAAAEQVMLGSYNPAAYAAATVLNHPDTISRGIANRVSPDSMHAYIEGLRSVVNRNTGSDTVSASKGIGAARRWVYTKFAGFSSQNGNRLIPSYLQFDMMICTQGQHRNVFAVLPGMDTADKSIIIIEGHMDSRCAGLCDTACLAEGAEDNGSGTALVMELARVMSRYSYNQTIVFLVTIGEEQGLNGADAFAAYVQQKGIRVKAVFNNDVVGGIICGHTSSPPGCSGFNTIDSTNFRIFSYGGYNSFHKGLARFIKLEYQEMIRPYATVPMSINIMTPEDRSGRGGDHIPFRQRGYTSVRLTAANEYGDADVTAPTYNDRQHTSADVLGLDNNADGILDSFFVNFRYLARNAAINGNAAAMAAIGPKTPDFALSGNGLTNLVVQITQQTGYPKYRVGIRTNTFDWDSVYTFSGTGAYNVDVSALPQAIGYIMSVASVDNNGVESLFSREEMIGTGISKYEPEVANVELLQNKPNPFDEATMISVLVHKPVAYKEAYISVADAASGKVVDKLPIELKSGVNEVMYRHNYHQSGIYVYTLIVDGKALQSKKMVFAN